MPASQPITIVAGGYGGDMPEDQAYDLLDDIDFYYKGEVPQDRKAITCIEQIGDRGAEVPIACMEECF